MVLLRYGEPLVTKTSTSKTNTSGAIAPKAIPTKHSQVIDLLTRDGGATLEAMSTKVGWLPHSTRAFMTGLKKKGYVIESEKVEGVRHYRITTMPAA